MASIYIYNLKGGKCVRLNSPLIRQEDVSRLQQILPRNLEGLAFESPVNKFPEDTLSEMRVEEREEKIVEYLKGIGSKLEQLNQSTGAVGFYDLALRINKTREVMVMKARALSQMGHADKAERFLARHTQDDPNAFEPAFISGKNALSRNDYAKALEYFEQAKSRLRQNNVEHKKYQEIVDAYIDFVSIYLDRDQLFSRNLDPEACIKEIQNLRHRTKVLIEELKIKNKADLQGMVFFLETQDEVFERWEKEMAL